MRLTNRFRDDGRFQGIGIECSAGHLVILADATMPLIVPPNMCTHILQKGPCPGCARIEP